MYCYSKGNMHNAGNKANRWYSFKSYDSKVRKLSKQRRNRRTWRHKHLRTRFGRKKHLLREWDIYKVISHPRNYSELARTAFAPKAKESKFDYGWSSGFHKIYDMY